MQNDFNQFDEKKWRQKISWDYPFNRVKKIFFDLKSWGPLKNLKTGSGPYLGLGPSINVKKRNENLAGLSL